MLVAVCRKSASSLDLNEPSSYLCSQFRVAEGQDRKNGRGKMQRTRTLQRSTCADRRRVERSPSRCYPEIAFGSLVVGVSLGWVVAREGLRECLLEPLVVGVVGVVGVRERHGAL